MSNKSSKRSLKAHIGNHNFSYQVRYIEEQDRVFPISFLQTITRGCQYSLFYAHTIKKYSNNQCNQIPCCKYQKAEQER